MAYPGPNELRQKVPNDGRGVTDPEIELFVADGISIVTLGNETAEETALSRRAVREYARAEILRTMKDRGDHIPTADIEAAESRSERYTDQYQASTSSTDDDAGYRPKAVVTETPW